MNVRLIIQKSLLAVMTAVALSSCDMMTEDRDDCPTGLYVNFVYDYNLHGANGGGADILKDNVGSLTLYVYDESDRLVASKTMGKGQLSKYGSYIHFTEGELPPDHTYRLMAVALQKDWQEALATPGAKYRQTGNSIGTEWQQFFVTLDHQPAAARALVPFAAMSSQPLDTLWHTLTTITTPADSMPIKLHPAMLTPAKCNYTWQRDGSIRTNGQETVRVVKDEPTYATVALIRDTKHLNITLRSIDNENEEDNMVKAEDYTVEIIDNNSQVDCRNDLSNPADTLIYTPYRQWNTTFTGTDLVASEQAAHYDLMFNRLVYKNASVTEDQYAILNEEDIAKARNAVLLIRKKIVGDASERHDGDIIFGINLPYILSSGRTYQERYYHYQEYLDREYDYRLQFILKGGRIDEIQLYIGAEVHVIPWATRQQHETL